MSQQKDTLVGQQVTRHTANMMANGFVDNKMAHRLLKCWPMGLANILPKGWGDKSGNVRVSGLVERLLTHWPKYYQHIVQMAGRQNIYMLANLFGRHYTKILTNKQADRLPTWWPLPRLVSTLPNVWSIGQSTHCQHVGRHTANVLADALADTLPTCWQMGWQTHCQHVGRHTVNMLANGLADTLLACWQKGWQIYCQHVGKWVGRHTANMLANGLAYTLPACWHVCKWLADRLQTFWPMGSQTQPNSYWVVPSDTCQHVGNGLQTVPVFRPIGWQT